MTEWDRLMRKAKVLEGMYPAGTRIELLEMGNDPRPIAPNTRGTVVCVDSIGTIHCDFDNGRQLGLIHGEDVFRIVKE
jgi:hypothetical protein